jgi:hypothetical protein
VDIALYRTSSGVYIAVPDCMRPSIEAEHRHGPLEFHGLHTVADETAQAFAHLSPDLDEHNYAVLHEDEASRVLAAGNQKPDCDWIRRSATS